MIDIVDLLEKLQNTAAMVARLKGALAARPESKSILLQVQSIEKRQASLTNQFNAASQLMIETDPETGEIIAVYLRIRRGRSAETREIVAGVAYADYDRRGRLLGIELLHGS